MRSIFSMNIQVKTIKKHYLLLFFMLGMLFFSAINTFKYFNQSHGDAYEIGVLFPGFIEFFEVQKKAMIDTAEVHGVKLHFLHASWDSFVQTQQIQNFIGQDMDAILLCSVDNKALVGALELFENIDTPLITFTNSISNDPLGDYDGVVSHIGRDEVKAGELLAKQIEMLNMKEQIKIVYIQGSPGTAPQRLREYGFLHKAEQKNWEVTGSFTAEGWNEEIVYKSLQRLIDSGVKFNVIATQWANAAVSAANLLDKNNINDVRIVSLEYSEAIRDKMQRGQVQSTTFFSIEQEGSITIETVINYLKFNKQPPKFIEIEQYIVTQSDAANLEPAL